MIDKLNGRRMGMNPTGSGRRQSYKYAPTSRMTNTYIANGDDNPEDIIKSISDGLYAKKMGGGSVNLILLFQKDILLKMVLYKNLLGELA